MADIPDHARKTLDDLRQDVTDLITKLYEAVADMNRIERRYGAQPTSLMDLMAGLIEPGARTSERPALSTNTPGPGSSRGGVTIRPDQYLGHPPLEAAKSYIGEVGHAVPFDEIADAVARGGAAVKGADWKETLEKSLLRSVNDVIKVQEHVFGLIRFYTAEQIKALRATRRQASTKPKRRGRPPKKKASAESKETERRGPKRPHLVAVGASGE